MGIHDHQRGERDGYSGIHHAPPASADEALGRAAGESRRERERQRSQGAGSGYRAAALPLRWVPAAIVLGVALLMGVRLSDLALFAAGAILLLQTPRLNRLLRQATPVYIGAALGLCLSAMSLMGSDAPLIADNVATYPVLGAGLGLLFSIGRMLIVRRSKPK